MNNSDLVNRIASSLIKGEMFERVSWMCVKNLVFGFIHDIAIYYDNEIFLPFQAGDLYEKIRMYSEALKCYKKGDNYKRGNCNNWHMY